MPFHRRFPPSRNIGAAVSPSAPARNDPGVLATASRAISGKEPITGERPHITDGAVARLRPRERHMRCGTNAWRASGYPRQPRGDERRSGAGGLAAPRAFQSPHDAAIFSSRRPRDRAGRREGGRVHRKYPRHLKPPRHGRLPSFTDGETSRPRRHAPIRPCRADALAGQRVLYRDTS